MANNSYKFWAIPLTLWGLYSCWYFGYQSGYADGHVTAWNMYSPDALVSGDIAYSDDGAEIKSMSASRGR